jgi:uncharacterized protein YecE (DUF72 family)
MSGHKTDIRVGIGGWTFEPWRGTFYPEGLAQKRELDYASRQVNSIEINGTYYGTQKRESFAKWHDETPDDFVFALKGPRFTTNRRVLATAGESIERFLTGGIAELKDKLGPINWQFMATKKFDAEDFEGFLKLLPKTVEGRPLRHAVEVRHDSFRTPEFVAMARAYEVAIVLAADSEFPQIAAITAPFVYARIMGTSEAEEAGYSATALAAWAGRARLLADGEVPGDLASVGPALGTRARRDVFLYVISGFKPRNPRAAMAIAAQLR